MPGFVILAFFVFIIVAVVRGVRKSMRALKNEQQRTLRGNAVAVDTKQAQKGARSEVATLENWLRAQGGAGVASAESAMPPPLPNVAPESLSELESMQLTPIGSAVLPAEPTEPVVRPKRAAPTTSSKPTAERPGRRPDPVTLQTRPARVISSPVPVRSDATALERALAKAIEEARDDAAPGPSLALSSSLVRPLAHLYSVVTLIASPSPDVARKSFARVAAKSRFFGLSLTDEADLDEVRLRTACSALRRSDGVFEEAIERDLETLDTALGGVATAIIQRLRGLLK